MSSNISVDKISTPNPLLDIPSDRRLRLRSMRISLVEGAFAMVLVGSVETFYIPYLNAMGATPLQIGLGVSLPALTSGIIQLLIPMALKKNSSRKKLTILMVFSQALCFIPFGLMCQLKVNWAVWPAIAAFAVSAISGNIGGSVWADWMGHIVPKRRRGKYFANRNRILGLIQLGIAIIAARFLDGMAGKVLLSFTIIWFVCFFFRICSGFLSFLMYEPQETSEQKMPQFSFGDFNKKLFTSAFGQFTTATSLMSMAVNFAAPFFAIHMLNNLKFSYTEYTILNMTAVAANIVSLGLWGKIIDRVGSILPIRLCAFMVAMVPLLWVIYENYRVLFLAQILVGISWGGYNLSAFTFYLSAVKPRERVSNIAYYNAFNFFGVFAGATLGGWLAPHLPQLMKFHLQTVFLVSAILRLAPALMYHKIKEQPYIGKLNALERMFFYPQFTMRNGITRSIMRHLKRTV